MPICQMFCAIWSTIFYFLHVLIHVAQQNLVFACKLDNICPQITKICTQKSRLCTRQGRLGMHKFHLRLARFHAQQPIPIPAAPSMIHMIAVWPAPLSAPVPVRSPVSSTVYSLILSAMSFIA